jgi:transmembrane sensor
MMFNRASSGDRPSAVESIEARAAAWIAQRDDGLSPAEAEEFARWRAADPRHEAAIVRLEATWSALAGLRDFRPEASRHPDRDLLQTAAASRPQSRWVWPVAVAGVGAAAVACALVVALMLPRGGVSPPPDSAPVYATTQDGYQRVALPDGSNVELNASSEVSVHFAAAERRVRLVRGEAHFIVAKDRARPFVVEAGSLAVRAVGTAFNVRLGARDIEVLVTEGKVAVGDSAQMRSDRASVVPASTEAGVAAELAANYRLVVPVPLRVAVGEPLVSSRVERVTDDAMREALAWQGPRLVFADTPLADAIQQFNRRNPVQLELGDADLAAVPIGGSFRAENVDAFVRLLTAGGEVTVERPEPNRMVLRRAGGPGSAKP